MDPARGHGYKHFTALCARSIFLALPFYVSRLNVHAQFTKLETNGSAIVAPMPLMDHYHTHDACTQYIVMYTLVMQVTACLV